MGCFHYRARSKHGELFVGELQASDIHEAALRIREKGLWVVGLEEVVSKLSWRERLKGILFKEINIPGLSGDLGRKEEALFLSQLASLMQAGLPLQQALGNNPCQHICKLSPHHILLGQGKQPLYSKSSFLGGRCMQRSQH